MAENIRSLRLTADEMTKKVEQEKLRIRRECNASRPQSQSLHNSTSQLKGVQERPIISPVPSTPSIPLPPPHTPVTTLSDTPLISTGDTSTHCDRIDIVPSSPTAPRSTLTHVRDREREKEKEVKGTRDSHDSTKQLDICSTHEDPDSSVASNKIQSANISFGSIYPDKDDKIALSPFQTNDPSSYPRPSSSKIPDNISMNRLHVDPRDVSDIGSAHSVVREEGSKADMKDPKDENVLRNVNSEKHISKIYDSNNNEKDALGRGSITEMIALDDLEPPSEPLMKIQKGLECASAPTVPIHAVQTRKSKIPSYSSHKASIPSVKGDIIAPVSDLCYPPECDRMDGAVSFPIAADSQGEVVMDPLVDVYNSNDNAEVVVGDGDHGMDYTVEEEVEEDNEGDEMGEKEEEEWQEETEEYRNLISKFDHDASLLQLIGAPNTTDDPSNGYGVDPLRASLVEQVRDK